MKIKIFSDIRASILLVLGQIKKILRSSSVEYNGIQGNIKKQS